VTSQLLTKLFAAFYTCAYINKCNIQLLTKLFATYYIPSKPLPSIDMNTIQQLPSAKPIPLHVNSPAIAGYPWQTAILKATNLDDTFKSTDLKVKAL
jgi:hypothetical protein